MEIPLNFINQTLQSTFKVIGTEISEIIFNRLLEYQTEEYKRNYYTKTILHRIEPIKLYSFYLPLHLTKFKNYYKRERIPTKNIKELFSNNNYITLIGTAGSGKSTLIKYLILKATEEKFKIPIKIELRYLNHTSKSFLNYIEDEIFKFNQLATGNNFTNRLLHSGKFVFFLDGYDELSHICKEKVTKEINEFIKLYNTNNYLITSRPYTNIDLLENFTNYEVCPLSEEEIKVYVAQQFPDSERETSKKIIDSIETKENSNYSEYLKTPLLLSMFILTFQTYSNVPPKKSHFYKQVFDSLFYLHDSISKMSYTREKKSQLSKDEFEEILKIFCFITFFQETFVFDGEYLNNTLNDIKEKKKNLSFENAKLIDDLQVAICILHKEGLDYAFPHRSLQEYFASSYLLTLEEKNRFAIYKKIYRSMDKYDFIDLFQKQNFYELMSEQDKIGVLRYITLPFLEKIITELSNNLEAGETENLIICLANFLIIFHPNFEPTKKVLDMIAQHFLQHKKFHLPIFENGNIIFKRNDVEKSNLNINHKNFATSLKPAILITVNSIKKFIEDETQSDSDILKMITV